MAPERTKIELRVSGIAATAASRPVHVRRERTGSGGAKEFLQLNSVSSTGCYQGRTAGFTR